MKMGSVSLGSARNANLDLLRAIAICLVVTDHIIQMSPSYLPQLMQYAQYGQYGVDLFFVLSGWLIGTLYWRETNRFGKIDLGRFWARRWIRTIPPYLAALVISWLAVFVQRHEPFDLGYLLFFQNYYEKIPFFLLSWSLCVEEHFYLLLPLVLFILPQRKAALVCLFIILFMVSPLGRYWESMNGVSTDFGYTHTATHLRSEGLILGFGLAYLPIFLPKQFDFLTRYALWAVIVSGLTFVGIQFLPTIWNYRIGLTMLAVGLAGTLVILVSSKQNALASTAIVRAVAIASYSTYLTHALVIHIVRVMVDQIPAPYWPLYFPLVVTMVIIVAGLFYQAVELTSIRLRDARIPRRVGPQMDNPGVRVNA